MLYLLAIAALAIIAASVYADYKWREWMGARKHGDRTNRP